MVYNCALFQRGVFRVSTFLAFLPFLLFGLLVGIDFPGNYSGVTFYLDFSFLLAPFCVPVAFIGKVESEPLPLKTFA
jgi:hypothetical protein